MQTGRVRFGDFDLDPDSYQLRRSGESIRLERIPMELLLLLVEQPGKLISRRALVDRVWGKDHFVEEDGAINTAVRKLRVALGDSVENPRFIETVTGKGYRFTAKVVVADPPDGGPPVHRGRILLAVLPFENLSQDPRESYLNDGVTDELITSLGELSPSHLGVIGRTSVTHCCRRGMTVEQIGRELGTKFVIEGSVTASLGRVRINVRLVSVNDQAQIWAKSYEREFGDLLAWQWDVAREIAGAVKTAVPLGSQPFRNRRVNSQAYEYYLKGLHHWSKRTPLAYIEAIKLFEQSIDADPMCPLPYSGLANAYVMLGIHGVRAPQDTYPKARAAAAKALEIDPTLEEAHTALGDVSKGFDREWREAETSFRQAIGHNSNYSLAHRWYANLHSILERHDEAIREAEEGRQLDPLSGSAAGFVAFTLYRARRFQDAVREAERAMDLEPLSPVVNWFSSLIYLQQRNYIRANEVALTAVKHSHEGAMYLATLASISARANDLGSAHDIARTLERRSAEQYVSPFDLFVAHAGIGNREAAMGWLEKAVEQRVMRVTELAMPLFDDLRLEPRFLQCLRRVGLPDIGNSS